MEINGENTEAHEVIDMILDLSFAALQGIADEYTDNEESSNALLELMIRNASERLGDMELD